MSKTTLAAVIAASLSLGVTLGASDGQTGRMPRRPCGAVPPGYKCWAAPPARFVYPRPWHAARYFIYSPFFHPQLYLSTEPFQDPCVRTEEPNGTREVCGAPVASLSPNGVLAEWMSDSRRQASLANAPGAPTRIGGRPAKIAIAPSGPFYFGNCAALGATEVIQAWVAARQGGLFGFIACIRGPDLDTRVTEIRTLLASARFPYDRRPP